MIDLKSKQIQLQFQGYVNTPLLWNQGKVLGLQQLDFPRKKMVLFDEMLPDNIRLGKRVERYAHHVLQQHENIDILAENVQVQQGKITIGEIDCILTQSNSPIHVEIVYKFYLYDPTMGTEEIERWIGPNRNDNLVKKLKKLRDKQLPLLYNEQTGPLLEAIGQHQGKFLQRVHFKAQLFLPYRESDILFEQLNEDCVAGFYIDFLDLEQLIDSKFYIPLKTDWLTEVHTNVHWMNYVAFHQELVPLINEKRAPLCWIKSPNGLIEKFFVVWWNSFPEQ